MYNSLIEKIKRNYLSLKEVDLVFNKKNNNNFFHIKKYQKII